MRRHVALLVLGLTALVAAGVGLWLWERTQRPPPAKRPQERLLIGFDPGRAERVRIVLGTTTLDRQRRGGEWLPLPGQPDGGEAVRIDPLLTRLATLKTQRMEGSGRRRDRGGSLGDAVAQITVWRGGARPLKLRFYRQGRRVVVRSSDRPGLYVVEPGLLLQIRREVGQATQAPALQVAADRLAKVTVKRKAGKVQLLRRSRRWYVEDAGALAAADPVTVGRLLRMLQDLRVRQRLGQGASARATHGLDGPTVTATLDDGKPHRLALGGPCPKDPTGRLAALGPAGDLVACVGPVDDRIFEADFGSNRLFSVSADELQAASVQRGRVTLALVNRPGSGGWRMISPTEGEVDQTAAARLATDLAELSGKPIPAEGPQPPTGARPQGQVILTPLVGTPERLDLWGAGQGDAPRWARRAGGGRWFTLPETTQRFLSADPVALRSLVVCRSDPDKVLAVARALPDGHTELNLREGGVWQLVLLQGRRGLVEAARIGKTLERFRPGAKPGDRPSEIQWKKPVLLVEPGDAEHRATLLHQLSQIRAGAYVARRASRAHGFDRQVVRVSTLFQHNCRDEDGKRKCDLGRCNVELTEGKAEGGAGGSACFGRVPGDGAVFSAPKALCEIARRPVASRRVTETPLHTLSRIALTAGRRRLELARQDDGTWRRVDRKPLPEGGVSHALLTLAPLQADAIAAYDRAGTGAPVLTASLSQPQLAPVELRFYEARGGEGYDVIRGDRPLRYRLRAGPVKALLALLPAP